MKTFNQYCENQESHRLAIKKIDGEWQVVWYTNEKKDEGKTYFSLGGDAEHKQDCVNTMKAMQKEIDTFNRTGKWH